MALKGDGKAFNCNKEALNYNDAQGEEEALKDEEKALNCKEDALT